MGRAMDKDAMSWIIPVLLAGVVGGAAWFYWQKTTQEAPVVQPPAVQQTEPSEPSGPVHPLPETQFSDKDAGQLRPLPLLDDSDEYLRLELSDLLGESIASLMVDSRIIEKFVATVDSLPRKHVAERIRPVGGLNGPFVADPVGDNRYSISEQSYRRYDPLVDIVAVADVQDLAELYRRYYPLFQDAYVELGYPDAYFNDRLVDTIDDMLATPSVEEPVHLVRPHVLFEFEDPDLESRSSGQKLLLRMGNTNAGRIKAKLQELRGAIAGGEVR